MIHDQPPHWSVLVACALYLVWAIWLKHRVVARRVARRRDPRLTRFCNL